MRVFPAGALLLSAFACASANLAPASARGADASTGGDVDGSDACADASLRSEQARLTRATRVIHVCHQNLLGRAPTVLRLRPREQLVVKVLDANPLIYSYALASDTLPRDEAFANAFATLFAAATATRPLAAGGMGPQSVSGCEFEVTPSADTVAFNRLAENILQYSALLWQLVIRTDEARNDPALAGNVRTCVVGAADALGLRALLLGAAILTSRLDALYAESRKTAEQTALRELAVAAAPAVVRFRSALGNLHLGPRDLVYDYPGAEMEVVYLTIRSRLDSSYEARRPAPARIGVVEVAPAYKRLEISYGLSVVRGHRATFSLRKITPDTGTAVPDTFEVRTDTTSDPGFVPSTFLTVQGTLPRADVPIGLSGGVGLRSDALQELDAAIDLMALLTVGHDRFRASVGGAWTSEIVSLRGVGEDGLTVDPNVLTNAVRGRTWRWMFALHMTP